MRGEPRIEIGKLLTTHRDDEFLQTRDLALIGCGLPFGERLPTSAAAANSAKVPPDGAPHGLDDAWDQTAEGTSVLETAAMCSFGSVRRVTV
jgi:hypothetical protein